MTHTETQLYKAALLHDIGKLIFRSGERGRHPISGSKFVETWLRDDTISHIVRNHHKADWRKNQEPTLRHLLALIACEADSMASGERISDNVMASRPLESIFNQISIGGRPKADAKHYQPIGRLSLEAGRYEFPKSFEQKGGHDRKELSIDYGDQWRDFLREADLMADLDPDTLLFLYKKYLWCVPSAYFHTIPDISLYEHSRLTAAIAVCLLRGLQHEHPTVVLEQIPYAAVDDRTKQHYLLVGGGFSGIQDYLYNIAHKGALKSLKGRSFWINFAVESIARYFLEKLDLPLANLVYANGGRFYLLLPATAEAQLSDLKKEIEHRLLDDYEGYLGLEFGVVKLTGAELSSKAIAQKWGEVETEIKTSKRRKFAQLATAKDSDFFEPFGPSGSVVQCQYTKKDLVEAEALELVSSSSKENASIGAQDYERWVVPATEGQLDIYLADPKESGPTESRFISSEQWNSQKLGYDIRDDRQVAVSVEDSDVSVLSLEHLQFHRLNHRTRETLPPDARRYILFNDDDFLSPPFQPGKHNEWRFYGGDWIVSKPAENGDQEPKTFEELAEDCLGIKRLGVLRMDVDDLGWVFCEGLNDKTQGDAGYNATFSRITQLSTMLDFFFCGYLNRLKEMYWHVTEGIIEGNHPRVQEWESAGAESKETHRLKDVLQIVYAGGDDLFITGIWNVLPDVALWIRDRFADFTNHSPSLGISAGISLFREKYPLYKAAADAGDMEDIAKEGCLLKSEKRQDKNSITLFDTVLTWGDLREISGLVKNWYGWLEHRPSNERPDASFLHKLSDIYLEFDLLRRRQIKRDRHLRDKRKELEEAAQQVLHSKWRWQAAYSLYRFGEQERNRLFRQEELSSLSARLFCDTDFDQNFIKILNVPVLWTDLLTRKD